MLTNENYECPPPPPENEFMFKERLNIGQPYGTVYLIMQDSHKPGRIEYRKYTLQNEVSNFLRFASFWLIAP